MFNFQDIFEECARVRQGTERLNIGDIDQGFYWCSPPYLFSTENLRDSYDILDFKGKNMLTVGSSGDHAIEAYRRGAKHVDMFDCNLFQKYVTELKFKMIRGLSYSNFMDYFFDQNNKMNPTILKDIVKDFSLPLCTFLNEYNASTNKPFFFHRLPFYHSTEYKTGMIPYIDSEEKFNDTKEKLPDTISFKMTNLEDVAQTIKQRYKLIHLSNIFLFEPNAFSHFIGITRFYNETVLPIIDNNLDKKNGQVVFSYMWGIGEGDQRIPNRRSTFKRFENTELSSTDIKLSSHEFEAIQKAHTFDGIMLLTRGGK